MRALFVLVTALGLTVALFALQNAAPVTIRFLLWQLDSSVAVVTLVAAASGAVIAWLLGLTSRLVRRGRSRAGRPEPPPPSGM